MTAIDANDNTMLSSSPDSGCICLTVCPEVNVVPSRTTGIV